MNKEFEKIIEKLEEEKMSYFLTIANTGDEKLDCAYEHTGDALDKAIEIVKQEAGQYQSSEIGFISKTEVLKLIEEIKCKDDIPKNYGTLLDIMRMIRNMPTVDNTDNGWIPCIDLLPEESGEYLTCVEYDGDRFIAIDEIDCDGIIKEWNCSTDYKVIAWKPLPQPYQPKGE